jgi:hypothetical protein
MPIVTRMSKKIISFSIATKAADDNNDNYVLVKETTLIQCDTLLHMKIKV